MTSVAKCQDHQTGFFTFLRFFLKFVLPLLTLIAQVLLHLLHLQYQQPGNWTFHTTRESNISLIPLYFIHVISLYGVIHRGVVGLRLRMELESVLPTTCNTTHLGQVKRWSWNVRSALQAQISNAELSWKHALTSSHCSFHPCLSFCCFKLRLVAQCTRNEWAHSRFCFSLFALVLFAPTLQQVQKADTIIVYHCV